VAHIIPSCIQPCGWPTPISEKTCNS
jgi:hypothetical protein